YPPHCVLHDTSPTEIYTLSLHDALPISPHKSELNADYWSGQALQRLGAALKASTAAILAVGTDFDTASHPKKTTRAAIIERGWTDRKSTRLNSSHVSISYAVFCLKKKTK